MIPFHRWSQRHQIVSPGWSATGQFLHASMPVARTSKRWWWWGGWIVVVCFWHCPNGKGPFAAGQLQKDVSCSQHSFGNHAFMSLSSCLGALLIWSYDQAVALSVLSARSLTLATHSCKSTVGWWGWDSFNARVCVHQLLAGAEAAETVIKSKRTRSDICALCRPHLELQRFSEWKQHMVDWRSLNTE